MAMRRGAAGLAWVGVLALWLGAGPALAQNGSAAAGRAFAERQCAQCHAIGRSGASPQAAAPPLRDLHRRYPVEQLAEAFAEGVVTGHAGMPEFQLEVAQINDLLAFLRSLER